MAVGELVAGAFPPPTVAAGISYLSVLESHGLPNVGEGLIWGRCEVSGDETPKRTDDDDREKRGNSGGRGEMYVQRIYPLSKYMSLPALYLVRVGFGHVPVSST